MKINDKQLKLVDRQIKRIIASGNYYSEIYKKAGITGVETPEDFEKIPFTDKADLRNAYPLGIQAAPDEDIVRIHSSSGTTGKPVIIPYTSKDVEDWAEMFARCYEIAGITKKDRIHITPGYGLWTAGIGFQAGCEKLGAMAVPMGPGNTEKQLQMMMDLGSTVLCATSSYALLLAEEINKRGIKDKIKLKKGVIGSERWSDAKRNYIARELGIELYDIYGLTEIYGPGIGINCSEQTGMHIFDDFLYTEIIDPVTGEVLPDGEEGELVFTTLDRTGTPMVRYRTRDLSRLQVGECKCGRTMRVMDRVHARSDDMLIIHGVNVFPSQIEACLMKVPEVAPHYMIELSSTDTMDRFEIKVEVTADSMSDSMSKMEAVRKRVAASIKEIVGLSPKIMLVAPGSLPRSEGKIKRVIDNRRK